MSSTQPIDARTPSPEPNWATTQLVGSDPSPPSAGTPQPYHDRTVTPELPPDDSSDDEQPVAPTVCKRKRASVESDSESDDDSSDDEQPVSPTVKKPKRSKPDDDSGDESDDSGLTATTTEEDPEFELEAFFDWLNLPADVDTEVREKAYEHIAEMYGNNSNEIIAYCLGDKKKDWTTTVPYLFRNAPDLVGPIIAAAVRLALKAETKKSSKRNTAEKPVWTMRTLRAHLAKNGYKGEINDGGTIPDNVLKLISQFMERGCPLHMVKSTHFSEHAGHRVSHTVMRVCVEIPSSRPAKDGHVRIRCVGTAKDFLKFYPVSGVYWGSKDQNIVFSGTKLTTADELDAFVKSL